VPDVIVKTVNGFTKVFVGEIVEKAREVQAQWLAAEKGQREEQMARLGDGAENEKEREKLRARVLDNEGPLMPDHIREAMRRYRKGREGGDGGMRGVSLTAMRGGLAGLGGRRLFR
jgi:transcription initiation factor TFIID subunit 11